MEFTAPTAGLAAAAAQLVRLVPAKLTDPLLSGMVITAGGDGVTLAATDRERAARVGACALVHTDGEVLVPARALAETLRALDAPEVRLAVEGGRLAVRAPGARFALPLLDVHSHPGVPQPPPLAGTVGGAALAEALGTVA